MNREGLEFFGAEFNRLGLDFVPSHGNFILVRVGKGQEVFKQLLGQGVIVRPMGGYRFPEHVRVTVGTMEENRKFIEALQKVIRVFSGGSDQDRGGNVSKNGDGGSRADLRLLALDVRRKKVVKEIVGYGRGESNLSSPRTKGIIDGYFLREDDFPPVSIF